MIHKTQERVKGFHERTDGKGKVSTRLTPSLSPHHTDPSMSRNPCLNPKLETRGNEVQDTKKGDRSRRGGGGSPEVEWVRGMGRKIQWCEMFPSVDVLCKAKTDQWLNCIQDFQYSSLVRTPTQRLVGTRSAGVTPWVRGDVGTDRLGW